jgi:hypothetical protein
MALVDERLRMKIRLVGGLPPRKPRPSCRELEKMYKTDPRLNPLLEDSMDNLTFSFVGKIPKLVKEPSFESLHSVRDKSMDSHQSLTSQGASTRQELGASHGEEGDVDMGSPLSPRSASTSTSRKRGRDGREPIVCRYFLMGRCMKGSACEWSHKMDQARMDWCKFGLNCTRRPNCPFIHIDQLEKVKDCENYDAGFCPHGPACKKHHVARLPSELPRVSQIILDDIAGWAQRAEEEERRKTYRKTSLCRAWAEGGCRRGERCTFAHGYTDMSVKGLERLEGRSWYTDPISKEKLYLDGHKTWWKPKGDGSGKLMKL